MPSTPATDAADATADHATSSLKQNAAEIVSGLDLATKVRLLSGRGFWLLNGVPEAGLEGVVMSDGPHGLRCQVGSGDHLGIAAARPATCFPTAVTMGSSWDVDMVRRVGEALGREAVDQGVAVVLGPGLNLKRHPAGGRSFEYYSEDPYLSGRLATASVEGVQSQGVGTSVKHFAVNNQESHRLVVDAVVDERTMRELYLTGFEMVVTEARPWTVMSSYNRINGTYASDNVELLTTILREEWGFDGLVVSDWGGTNDRVAGVEAGMDLEMPGSHGAFDPEVIAAVQEGRLDEAAVDRCVERVVELLIKGQRIRSGATAATTPEAPSSSAPDSSASSTSADYDAHHALAREAAAAGSVLLTNDGTLPLAPQGNIAVIGALATTPRYQGAGSSQVTPTRLDVALERLTERVGDHATVTFAEAYDPATGASTDSQFAEALRTARDADVVVCFVGLPASLESEGFDRADLDLPNDQMRLVEALAAGPAPVVVVLNNGSIVHLPWLDRTAAVLECWLGGQAGGSAAVDVLFGDAEPGGRLAESLPHHIAQAPVDRWFPGEARQVEHREGLYVGYRFHDSAGVPAQRPFGFGLSYTSFEWSDITVRDHDGGTPGGTDLAVSVTVTNTGDRTGSDVVQVYVRDVESSVARPDKELKGFAKVHLAPGESDTVTITLDRRSFAVWDVDAHDWLVEAGTYEVVVARSSADPLETVAVQVASDDVLGPDPRPVARAADDVEFATMLRRPIPRPAAARPFHRNSTLEELSETAVGRALGAIVVREGVRRSAQEFPDPDEATVKMVKSAIKEGPIRSLALMSEGLVKMEHVDALIEGLNGRWSAAGRTALDAIRKAASRR